MSLRHPLILVCLLISSNIFAQTDSLLAVRDTSLRIFEKVDIEASFPGGERAWRTFLEKNLNPNVPVDNGAPTGLYTVYIQFVVDKDGSVTDIRPLTKQGYGMEQEVVRLMQKSAKWTPAMQNGRPVKAYRKQPISFMVSEDGFEIATKTPYVLFVGDNELTIKVEKVKSQDLDATITQGKITKTTDGKFIANITKPGRVIVTVFNTKKNKEAGSMSFEVRAK